MLTVGPISEPALVAAIEAHLASCGVDAVREEWNRNVEPRSRPTGGFRDAFRILSVVPREVVESELAHLPMSHAAIWLPIDFAQSHGPLLPSKLDPIFLASAPRLLADLERVAPYLDTAYSPDDVAFRMVEALTESARESIALGTPMRGFH